MGTAALGRMQLSPISSERPLSVGAAIGLEPKHCRVRPVAALSLTLRGLPRRDHAV
jgi:hypothetical protein